MNCTALAPEQQAADQPGDVGGQITIKIRQALDLLADPGRVPRPMTEGLRRFLHGF